jgi:hypothetical protein
MQSRRVRTDEQLGPERIGDVVAHPGEVVAHSSVATGPRIQVVAILALAPWSWGRSGMAEIAGSETGMEPEHEAVDVVDGKPESVA